MSRRPPKYSWNRVPTCQRPYKPCTAENVSLRTIAGIRTAECSYGKTFFSSVTEISAFAPASPSSHMNTLKFLERKEWRGVISEPRQPGRAKKKGKKQKLTVFARATETK